MATVESDGKANWRRLSARLYTDMNRSHDPQMIVPAGQRVFVIGSKCQNECSAENGGFGTQKSAIPLTPRGPNRPFSVGSIDGV